MLKAPDVDRVKIFDKDDQAAKHCYVLQPGHLYQKFDPINIGGLEHPKITMFCSEVIMTKTFNLSKAGGLSFPFQFYIASFYSTWPLCLHLGSFGLDILLLQPLQLSATTAAIAIHDQ